MIPLEGALATVDESIGDRRVSTERIPVRLAGGRVLATDHHSRVDLPPFDKSAVDGYAVLADDQHDQYRLLGVVQAGQSDDVAIAPGTTVKVMTGAPVPRGAARVIMIEQATERDGFVRFDTPRAAANICQKAEDVTEGQTIVEAGSRIGALEIANLISCGVSETDVARQVTLAVISTGDEIVDSYDRLSPGKIINTNGPLLTELARQFAFATVREETVSDDKSKLTAAVERAIADADIVVLSGGVSAGDYDFVPEVLGELGLRIHFTQVGVKPGLPTTFATGDKKLLFGLAGNPVAVYLTFHLFVVHAAARLSGSTYSPRGFKVRLAQDFVRRSTTRTDYYPCRILGDGRVQTVAYHGPAHLRAVMQSDGFVVVPPGVKSLAAGEEVTFVSFQGWL